MRKNYLLFSLLLALTASGGANAQSAGSSRGAWGTTWNNPKPSLGSVMIQGQIDKKVLKRLRAAREGAGRTNSASATVGRNTSSRPSANKPRSAPTYSVLNFKPVPDSGVARQTANALAGTAEERASLASIFAAVQTSYEAEVAKEGKSNNVAAALTFFMATASMVYHQTDEPPDAITDALFEVLEEEMSASADIRRMTDLDKQKMHDWLVVSGGFLLAGYADAVQKSDQEQLGNFKTLANEFFKIVFGTGIEKFDLGAAGDAPAVETPVASTDASPVAAAAAVMHAADLVKEFESNEVRANQLYLGKTVHIRGNVNSIEAAPGGTVILTFDRTALTYTNARCFFNRSQGSRVASINANDDITVEGTVKGMGGGALGIKAFLVLENCRLL